MIKSILNGICFGVGFTLGVNLINWALSQQTTLHILIKQVGL
jgi:hypothetical protein